MRAAALLGAAVLAAIPPFALGATQDGTAPVRALLDAQVAAWNRGDLEGFMAGLLALARARVLLRRHGLERLGRDARALSQALPGGRPRDGKLRFEVARGRAARPGRRLRARRVLAADVSDGQQPHGRFTLVLRRLSGAWRIVHDHTSAAE